MTSEPIKNTIRIGIGSVFIIAAILKLISIDEFEIYIYSFDILNFLLTTFFSRIIIAGEFILGLFLILKINYKLVWRATMTILILFTLFLIYVAIFRNDDNCHCFGELIELNPVESIIKNVIVMILLLNDKWLKDFKSEKSQSRKVQSPKFKVQSPKFIAITTLLIVFIVSPPDVIYNKIYSSEKEISSDVLQKSFDDIVKINFENDSISLDSTTVFQLNEGNRMIAIVSSGCKYCNLGVKRLSMIMKRKGMESENVDVFIWGSDGGILNFIKETDTEDFSYWKINPRQAIDITYGRFPVFILLEDREIVDIGDFRNIDDNLF